jgi:hypothetical protein
MDDDWLWHRRLELYHRSMDHMIQDIDELCSKDIYLHFADDKVRLSPAFYHVLVMVLRWLLHYRDCVTHCEGKYKQGVASGSHQIEQMWLTLTVTESVKQAVSAALSEHLDDDGLHRR